MSGEKLRFRGVDFHLNPKSLQIKREKKYVRLLSPTEGPVVQEVGRLPAQISGEGELCGDTAAEDYRTLVGLFEMAGSGYLQLPGEEPIAAYFASLGALRRAGPDVLRYSFSFVEDPE